MEPARITAAVMSIVNTSLIIMQYMQNLQKQSSDSMDLSPYTAIRSSTSRSVHVGALLQFWDSMVTSADEICMVTCADQLATVAKQKMKFKSSRRFSCLPGQCIRIQNAVQSGHTGALG
ncbi:hypothetical protein UY3_01977 [Chelonia mydas]|uniref:Uncharacterized protein n=1 Tax=Chelonia mydas TaxID=8469 RepID=M7BSL7_CHEMY|nr:hypothetical protein UY3_01977 [Chelonia mydas]